jgi:hypothetical protein
MTEPEIAKEIIDTMPDASGTIFDPAVHERGSDGQPKVTKKGNFRKKRVSTSTIAETRDTSSDASYNACGSSTAEIFFVLGQAIGGPEWSPTNDERQYMTGAWTEYYKAKEVKDLPPGLIVATAMVSYALPRFSRPITRSRFGKMKHWFKMRLSRRYRESRVDSRDDGERQEHPGSSTQQVV